LPGYSIDLPAQRPSWAPRLYSTANGTAHASQTHQHLPVHYTCKKSLMIQEEHPALRELPDVELADHLLNAVGNLTIVNERPTIATARPIPAEAKLPKGFQTKRQSGSCKP
jgi:hypothetical protein